MSVSQFFTCKLQNVESQQKFSGKIVQKLYQIFQITPILDQI
jgi:hypothetical protein